MKNQKFSIFLIKAGRKDTDEIIKNNKSLKQFDIKISGLKKAVLFVKQLPSHPPKWLSLFKDMISDKDIRDLKSAVVSGVLLVDKGSRKYALTFGYGRALLEPGCYEERFGLIVTLNSIDAEGIRSIDKKTFDSPIYKHTRDQGGREGSTSDFGLNVDQDLVRSITGKPVQDDLGHRLTGAASLAVIVKADLSELSSLLDKYYGKFTDTSYKDIFPWADHFSQVDDKTLIKELNEALVDKINAKDFDRLWMSLPEIVDWSDISGFRYSASTSGEPLNDIDMESFLSHRGMDNIDIDLIKRKKVFAFNIDDTSATTSWRAYNCIYCELDRDGNTYILSDGLWYCIARTFVEKINSQYSRIRLANIDLPTCSEKREETYTERVAKDSKGAIALMDQKLIYHGGGKSKFEFCDLYTKDGQLIHVKKYGASSMLSHLISQALNSGRLFLMDAEFREKVNKKLPQAFRLDAPGKNINTSEYAIIFAIISREAAARVTLPFFSRVNLVLAAKELRGYGYKVFLKKISVSD